MGNIVGSLRQYKISSEENAIIIGTLLGDAYLGKTKNSVRLEIGHSESQKKYLFWKYKKLQKLTSSKPHCIKIFDKRYDKIYTQWRFKTKTNDFLEKLHMQFYSKTGKKVIPKNICSLLKSSLSLAVWFMDDGGRRNDCYGLFLNTLSFTKEENEILKKCLKKNFSFDSRLHWIQDGYRLYIPSKDAKRFCGIVYPYIIPSMRYKLSYNPVTTSFARLDRARDRGK
ncbi:hypothetical protein KKA23_01430 [Patescibacteria group bacterium]|nr:hypothetical protein [Patescibacteria group bacterium]